MGLPLSNLRVFLDRVVPGLVPGRAILLGVPEVKFSAKRFVQFCGECGVLVVAPDPFGPVTLWKAFGLDAIAVDVCDYEGACLVDLNEPIPDALRGSASFVFDPGTLEHVFDVRQAMFNIADMLIPGGWVLHHNPYQGWPNHGFHTPSQCLFHDFYAQNGFSCVETYAANIGSRLAGQDDDTAVRHLPYEPMGGAKLPAGKWVQYHTAKKTRNGPWRVPTQARYTTHLWHA